MAKGYRPVDRQQPFLLPPSMTDWLPEDHLVWLVIEAVKQLDTGAFHAKARLGGVGRAGYDPDMLLTLLVYAMAHGVRSSRQIERLCHTDVAFRIICANDAPDHTVLARFRQHHEAALTDLLTQTLLLCAQLGMVRLGVVAFDGTKIAGSAAKDTTYTEEHLCKLAAAHLAAVAETDTAEDDLFGHQVRGDEIPEKLRDRTHRGRRIQQAWEQIQARQAAEREQTREQQAVAVQYVRELADLASPPAGRPRAGTDPVAAANARWERERARQQQRIQRWQAKAEAAAAAGHKLPGPPPLPVDQRDLVRRARAALAEALAAAASAGEAAPLPDAHRSQAKANLTDPDSRTLKTRQGWTQGYNCQTAISEDGLIVSARATQDANDVGQFQPTMTDVTNTAQRLAAHTGRTDLSVGTMIGDAGYDSDDNLNAEGPDRLIPDQKRHEINQQAATNPATDPPPAAATTREKMNHRLRTPDGHTLYKRRAPLAEAPNAWLKDRRGLRHFTRRGLTAVQSELSFAAAVTNILKIPTAGITTALLRTT